MSERYAQCDDTCTVDCGHCKGAGPPGTRRKRASGTGVSREVGARVREIRTERGWRLVDLAAATGIKYQVLSKIELGERAVTVDDLMALTRALRTTSTSLLGLWS